VWVVKNTGCDVIVDDEEEAAMVVDVDSESQKQKIMDTYPEIIVIGIPESPCHSRAIDVRT
jgi:hypothetical protein